MWVPYMELFARDHVVWPESNKQRPHEMVNNCKLHIVREVHTSEDHLGHIQQPLREPTGPGMLDRSLQAKLGSQLRAIYSDVASEPVPERFISLLEELEAREKRR